MNGMNRAFIDAYKSAEEHEWTDPATPSAPSAPAAPSDDPVKAEFRPRWEVDGFRWPPVCRQLSETIGPELTHAAACLAELAGSAENVVAVGGSTRNRGATTLMICLARAAAARGMKVAIVDADLESPELAHRLGVAVPTSWQQASVEQEALEEAAVRSTDDGIVLFALHPGADDTPSHDTPSHDTPSHGDAADAADALRFLAKCFDVVLVDVGRLDAHRGLEAGHPLFAARPSPVHKAVLVVDTRHTLAEQYSEVQRLLNAAGVEMAALMENFAQRAA